jgi:Uma2 family endonuclease
MSTVDRPKTKTLLPLIAGQRLDQPTFHERYEAMPPETRAELVGGIVYMPSPMRGDHGTTDQIVAGWVFNYQLQTPGVEGAGGATVKLDQKGEPQPDRQLFIPAELGGKVALDSEGYFVGPPELVIEIARSSRAYDLGAKKADYERAGVQEYLVVELDPDWIHWFVRRGDHFEDLPPGPDGVCRSEVFPGLWLDPEALYDNAPRRVIRALEQGLATPDHASFAARLARAQEQRSRQ